METDNILMNGKLCMMLHFTRAQLPYTALLKSVRRTIGPRQFYGQISVQIELLDLGSFTDTFLSPRKLSDLCSFTDTFPTGLTKTIKTADLSSSTDTFRL